MRLHGLLSLSLNYSFHFDISPVASNIWASKEPK